MSTTIPEIRSTHRMPAVAELPLVTVWLDGNELSAAVLRTLGSVRIRQEVSAPAACELELELLGELTVPRRGMSVRIRIEGANDDVFRGELVAVAHHLGPDGIHRVRLRAFDKAHRLRQTADVTAHTDLTAAAFARTAGGRHGLGVKAAADGPRWPRIIQQGESDLEFLSRLAADAGLWWQLTGDDLELRPWRPGDTERAAWGVDLYEAVLESDGSGAATNVRTIGWDPVERKVIDANAGSSRAGGDSGVGDLLGGKGELFLVDRLLPTDAHAEAIAQSELDARTGAVDTVRAVVRGDTRWKPGVGFTIDDQPGAIAGPYLLTAVEHVVDAYSGYVSILSSRPVPRELRRTGGVVSSSLAAFTLAEVIDIDDPDGAGRVRVKLPTLDDVESEWLPVVGLGAGEDKGLLIQPDRKDTVLVLHAADDPGRGVVIGGLYTTHHPFDDAGITGGAVRRFGLNTPDKQRLLLNRDGDQVIIANSANSRIEVTKEAMLIHSAVDLTIQAPGRRLIIKADTVDFERG